MSKWILSFALAFGLLIFHIHANAQLLADQEDPEWLMKEMDAARTGVGTQMACTVGCFRKQRLPPLPGGVDFCYINDHDAGQCLKNPDCEFTCR